MKTLRRTVSDGIQTLYDVDFELGYFVREHVYVYAGDDHTAYDTQLSYVWQNDTQIELTVPGEYVTGTVINIRRIVPRDSLYVEFKNSTGITQLSLNSANAQALMLIEEQDDGFKPVGYYEKQDSRFGGLYTGTELRDGVEPQDAVTMKQVFDVEEGFLGQIVASATAQANRSESEADRAEIAADSIPDPSTLVTQDSATGSADIPSGTTAERSGIPTVGNLRFNTDEDSFEGYDGVEWAGIGGGGGLDWTSPVQTVDFVAEAGKGYYIDTSVGSVSMTLPPLVAEQVAYKDYAGTFDDFQLNIVPDGADRIEGNAETYEDASKGSGGTLAGSDATKGWLVINHTPIVTVQSKPLMHVQERKASGVSGGTTSAGYTDRPLSDIVTNEITGASLVAESMILPAGTYYIDGHAFGRGGTLETDSACRLDVVDSGGGVLLPGLSCGQSRYASGLPAVNGQLVLTQLTTVKLSMWSKYALADTGLGVQTGLAPYEVYADLKIWQLDAEKEHPKVYQPINQVVTGVYKTGNIDGGGFSSHTDTTVTCRPFSCTADGDSTPLFRSTETVVDLGTPAINTIYHFFMVRNTDESYGYKVSTDINGADLAGITHKRWDFFMVTNAGGNLCTCWQLDDVLWWDIGSESYLITNITLGTGWAFKDLSALLPIPRIRGFMPGLRSAAAADQTCYFSVGGVYVNSKVNSDFDADSDAGSSSFGFMNALQRTYLPVESGGVYTSRLTAASSSAVHLMRQSVTLRR